MLSKSSKYTIIVVSLIVALLVIILALAISLGLRMKRDKQLVYSCRNRCDKQSSKADGACECDPQCTKSKTCCPDYHDICMVPKNTWECIDIRCGEERLSGSNCHCSGDCQENGDCCTNYLPVCQDVKSWVDGDECESIETASCPNGFDRQPLILISLDGFRAEYMKTWNSLLPHLNKLRECGTSAPYMKAVYPTKTFPNHYSIVTGLYPESHGIVANSMYDVEFDAHFKLSSPEKHKPRWWGGQPIWFTAASQGVKAGTYFWPGSETPINNTHPSKWKAYNGSIPYEERIFTILEWLDLPNSERPGFFTLYFDEPDRAGHGYGPVSGQVVEALQVVDKIVGQLMDGLKQRNLHKCVNIIVVADHGMDAVSCSRVESLANYINVSNMFVYEGPAPRIRAYNVPDDYKTFPSESVVHSLSCVKPNQHFKPYLKWDQPKRLHNAANRRIEKAVLIVDRQWLVSKNEMLSKRCTGGVHGYDNEFKSMTALFMSYGPKFKNKTEVEPFENIELYNLMCDVLEIDSAPNNGTHGSLNHLLRKPSYIPKFPEELLHPESCQLTTYSSKSCSCSTPNDPPVEQLNKQFNLSDDEVNVSETTHLPLGRPINMQTAGKWCLLIQHSFISAFRMDMKAPLWVSYTIFKHTGAKPLPSLKTNCTRDDPRLQNGLSCSNFSSYGFLYPPNLNATPEYDGLITSNMMFMHPAFKILWEYIHNELLMKYAEGYDAMNVISGPIYDYNYDGVYDTAEQIQELGPKTTLEVPTHFFLLIATCVHLKNEIKWCEPPFNLTAFVLPHHPTNLESCADAKPPSEWAEERLWTHVARPRDVELLTGFRFYSDAQTIKGFDLSNFLWVLLIIALVVIILGLAIGLGIQVNNHDKQFVYSCRKRCLSNADGACECDSQCVKSKTCCPDYQDVCVVPKNTWECTNIRCEEERLPGSNCHCSNDCKEKGDCCTNYLPVCQAESWWVDDECEIIKPAECPNGFDHQPLILISLDGFRAEYMKTWYSLLPHLNKLRKCGTSASYMRSAYPTKTFPNHYTIVTGLYPESHGIVDNNMYDVEFNAHFSLSSPEKNKPRWWGGQPIWLTAEYQGVKAGTYFWPGSDVPINNTHPSKWEPYNGSVPYEARVVTILEWLDLQKDERPGFFTLYFDQPDHAGHGYGPVSGQVIEALQLVDKIVGQLMDGLKQRNLHKCVNIIVVADHGMDAVSCSRVEHLANYINVSNMYVYQGPAPRIRAYNVPDDYKTFPSKSVVQKLSCVKPNQHFKPYLKCDQPKRLHNAANRRIDKAVLIVDRQWLVSKNFSQSKYCTGGNHGYDNEFKSMTALFISYGPKFKDKTEVEPFENIELYNLMCDILEIDSAPNNGTHGSLNHLLRKPSYIPKFPEELLHPESCQLTTYSSENCSCSTPNDPAVEQLNQQLNLSDAEVNVSETTHLPLGRPINMQPAGKWCLLMQHSFISAFRMDRKAPLWVSYTIFKHTGAKPLPSLKTNCTRDDPRLPNGTSCSNFSSYGFLYPPNLNTTHEYDGLITSNMMFMHPAFKILWEYIHNELLMKYAEGYDAMNVISGPIYDYSCDGVYDTAEQIEKLGEKDTPTHFFLLIATCVHLENKIKWCKQPFNLTAFVLPHQSTNLESCADGKPPSEWVEQRLWTHVARPRDVELLTGFRFYSDAKNINGFDLSNFLSTMTTIKFPPTESCQ